jgi:hypothetical protein
VNNASTIDLVIIGEPKIKHNNPPLANASEKRRLQTNALKTKLKSQQHTVLTSNNVVGATKTKHVRKNE